MFIALPDFTILSVTRYTVHPFSSANSSLSRSLCTPFPVLCAPLIHRPPSHSITSFLLGMAKSNLYFLLPHPGGNSRVWSIFSARRCTANNSSIFDNRARPFCYIVMFEIMIHALPHLDLLNPVASGLFYFHFNLVTSCLCRMFLTYSISFSGTG